MKTEVISALLDSTYSADPKDRQRAAGQLCPCHLKRNLNEVWERLFEMSMDPDPGVRRAVVHSMTDGSPRVHQEEVTHILEGMKNDADRRTRRMVRHNLARYRRTGVLNIPE